MLIGVIQLIPLIKRPSPCHEHVVLLWYEYKSVTLTHPWPTIQPKASTCFPSDNACVEYGFSLQVSVHSILASCCCWRHCWRPWSLITGAYRLCLHSLITFPHCLDLKIFRSACTQPLFWNSTPFFDSQILSSRVVFPSFPVTHALIYFHYIIIYFCSALLQNFWIFITSHQSLHKDLWHKSKAPSINLDWFTLRRFSDSQWITELNALFEFLLNHMIVTNEGLR